MKRIVVHGMKESGWFADNPTNPHVAGATAGGGTTSEGNYGNDGTASGAQAGYASSLIVQWRDGYLYQTPKDPIDQGNKVDMAISALQPHFSSGKREWRTAMGLDLIAGSHKWLGDIDPSRMSRTGVSKLIDTLKKQDSVSAWIGSIADMKSPESVAAFLNGHTNYPVVVVTKPSGARRILPENETDRTF
jgi:hypothetical protein